MNKFNKSKIATALLGAMAFGADVQARDFNKNKITKTDSSSMIENSKLGNKPPQVIGTASNKKNSGKNTIVRTDSFSILGKVAMSATGLGVAYNETAGVISGESWSKGKYSIVNGARSILNDKKNNQDPEEQKEQNLGENRTKVSKRLDEQKDEAKENVESKEKKVEKPENTEDNKENKENDENLNIVLEKFKSVAKASGKLELFEKSKPAIEGSYNKFTNSNYKFLDASSTINPEMILAAEHAIVNFMTNRKIFNSDAEVVGLVVGDSGTF